MSVQAAPAVVSRLATLRQDAMARGGSFIADANPFVRDVALWRALGERRSRVQVRARLLRELVGLAEIRILPDWNLAGEHMASGVGGFGFAFQGEPDVRTLQRIGELGIVDGDAEEVRRAVHTWSASGEPHFEIGAVDSENAVGHGSWTAVAPTHTAYWANGWIENHSIRDYAKVLRLGFAGIRREVE